MKVPSFQINWLMVIIAIAAINFAAFRAWYFEYFEYWNNGESFIRLELLVKGALPMANVLGVGLLIGLRRHRSRPFLWGFLVFGTVALVLYVLALFLNAGAYGWNYLAVVEHSLYVLGFRRPYIFGTIFDETVTVVLLGWPQMAFALIGGFLSRKSRTVVLQIVLALLIDVLIVLNLAQTVVLYIVLALLIAFLIVSHLPH
jgi:hypothetical protein